ncbi:hypothetical protein GJA_3713 [Janthinobacterium agaricidamnosum NBRC 102515 = DSM 9628]|uniref:Uncharacterized protein n=1 Tax=Janthinobacterium agaricidamnosum NBRC 102515 = DSM 9628 TaxID=1349767 RepID=W0VAM5_9BURK|nr:hypothetical protein GJA_3713 [Janthinobacterium agaricidamnosum NBRC 102515 = DSM 9628]
MHGPDLACGRPARTGSNVDHEIHYASIQQPWLAGLLIECHQCAA